MHTAAPTCQAGNTWPMFKAFRCFTYALHMYAQLPALLDCLQGQTIALEDHAQHNIMCIVTYT